MFRMSGQVVAAATVVSCHSASNPNLLCHLVLMVSLCGAGSKVKPVIVSKAEPEVKPLPASALSLLHAGLPSSDPGMHVLHWAFADHLPKAWTKC